MVGQHNLVLHLSLGLLQLGPEHGHVGLGQHLDSLQQHSNSPVHHSWLPRHILVPAGLNRQNFDIVGYHILPVLEQQRELLRNLLRLRNLRLVPERLQWVHSIVETDGLWMTDTPHFVAALSKQSFSALAPTCLNLP